MSKKSFKNKGGLGGATQGGFSGMYGKQAEEPPSADPKTPQDYIDLYRKRYKYKGKQKPSEKGYIRHTVLIKPLHLAELQDVAYLTKSDVQDVLAAALEIYFTEDWPPEEREEMREERRKEKEEHESLLRKKRRK